MKSLLKSMVTCTARNPARVWVGAVLILALVASAVGGNEQFGELNQQRL